MRAVELFAGAGGLAMGTALAGFRHDLVLEWNHDACETIRANQGRGVGILQGWPLHEGDARTFDYATLPDGVTLVAGGPPCQPFSLGGKAKGHEDCRDMFPEAVRAVRELRPRGFIFENVKGLLRRSFAAYFDYIVLQLTHPGLARVGDETWEAHAVRLKECHASPEGGSDLTYRVGFRLLNAADFGVPQRRERVVFVGFRSDQPDGWDFPVATHTEDRLLWDQWVTGEYWERHGMTHGCRPVMPDTVKGKVARLRAGGVPSGRAWRTVRDAIAGLPDPVAQDGPETIPNHRFNPGARSYPGHTGSPLDLPAKTLKAGAHGVPGGENMLVNEDGSVRYFTVRESARLQTFPDGYTFPGAWGEAMRQIGNAVPVELARAVASSVHAHLAGC